MRKSGRCIIVLGNILLVLAITFAAIALFGEAKEGEAYIGEFGTESFNYNWQVKWKNKEQYVNLPAYLEECEHETVIMENILPDYTSNGMRLCMRSALQEMRFFVDGELRSSYIKDDFPYAGEHLPSSYIMVDLNEEDAGKIIRIEVTTSGRGRLNEINIGYGNNAWFQLLYKNLPVVIAAIMIVVMGVLAIAVYFILRKRLHLDRAICFLGQTMIVVGMWILSETNLRQLIFNIPSYSGIFAYLFLEVLGGFVAMYFNEVQKHKYEKAYLLIEVLIFGQTLVNVFLAVTGIADLYSTLVFSHIWLAIGLVLFAVTVFIDIKNGRYKEYQIVLMGMVSFFVFGIFEFVVFYLKDFYILGKYLCAGLIIMLVFTVMQSVAEEFKRIRVTVEKEKFQVELEKKVDEQTIELKKQQEKISELFVETVTALSEAVDAKDRYTSGHSKRVAEYARMIAERMGKGKAEQDEIYRAGLLHDVGKIRIPAEIINKPKKLTDEEYDIIKLHPITGYHILRGISDNSGIALATKYHHERYDGKGYPNGLMGKDIPEIARILGVADSYDAMASNRSYRTALPQEVVRNEILIGKGTQFDPEIADIMMSMIDEDKNYIMKESESRQKRILVIDDEVMNHKVIARIMKDELRYKIIFSQSGNEGLGILSRQEFDLILLDYKMPEMDGYETLKLIRDKYSTPVVLMTGDRNQNTFAEFAALGCDDYITKPILPLMLREVVHSMTERMNY